MKITRVERLTLHIPFLPIPEKHVQRANTHGEAVQVVRVETDGGIVAYGEGGISDAASERAIGANPAELLWDDFVGLALQMASLDMLGKSLGVPAHKLLGRKVRDEVPISYWAIDMPPEDWVAEATRAHSLGYTSIKIKARPWRDIIEQVDALSRALPPHFRIDVDFNSFLLNAGNAAPILRQLEEYKNVAMYETPIPQADVEGYRFLRRKINRPIAMHIGIPPVMTALREEVCDGFVIGGGLDSIRRSATLAAEANKPFWLQLVGTGITTALVTHLGAVLSHAQWPAITCHDLWQDDLLTDRLEINGGFIKTPEAPGLGVEVNEEAIEKYRVEPGTPTPKELYLRKPRSLRVEWSDGRRRTFPNETAYQQAFYAGNLPVFERGVKLVIEEG